MHTSPDEKTGPGVVFDIQRFSVHDGPGIRTTVFLKGCPLHCLWCHNPESQRIQPELSFERELCILCGNCVAACPEDAQSISGGRRYMKRDSCAGCGECVESCYTNALALKGSSMTVEDVLEEVLRDEKLYAKSGGGITLSGGEPAMQPAFSLSILKGAKDRGLHTAVETCGAVRWNMLADIAKFADMIIYDIKHMDTAVHERLTGAGNGQIIANLEHIAAQNRRILVRMPLIPGFNDDDENLKATAHLIRRLGIDEVEIIPYHDFAAVKYKLLDIEYGLCGLKAYTPDLLCAKKRTLMESGLHVKIGV